MRQERWPTGLGCIFPPPDNSNREREKLKSEGDDNLQKTARIGQMLINYKHLALSKRREPVNGESGPYGHYAFCGCYGKHNKSMVPCVSHVMSKNKTFPLNHNLTCANCGIYVATCVICHEQYVGQIKNKISKKCSSYRSNWNTRPNCENDKNDKDEVAFLRHYSVLYGIVNNTTDKWSLNRYFC